MPTPDGMIIQWDVVPAGNGWKGTITIPLQGGNLKKFASLAERPESALLKAATGADKLVDSVLANPLARALLPPGTDVAVKGLKMLSQGIVDGNPEAVLQKFVGPAADRARGVVNALKSLF